MSSNSDTVELGADGGVICSGSTSKPSIIVGTGSNNDKSTYSIQPANVKGGELDEDDKAMFSTALNNTEQELPLLLPQETLRYPEVAIALIENWGKANVAKEESKASIVASTCGLLSTKLQTGADVSKSQIKGAADVMVNRIQESNKTERTKEECSTQRDVRRLQLQESQLTTTNSPWNYFTGACTMAFGLSNLRAMAGLQSGVNTNGVGGVVVRSGRGGLSPARFLKTLIMLFLIYLASRHPRAKQFLQRFMLWKHPRFGRGTGYTISLDGRWALFDRDGAEAKIQRPLYSDNVGPLEIYFEGKCKRFQAGCTDGLQYWLVEAPKNGKIAFLESQKPPIDVGEPEQWGLMIDLDRKNVYLSVDRKIKCLIWSEVEIRTALIWPCVIGSEGEKVELVWATE